MTDLLTRKHASDSVRDYLLSASSSSATAMAMATEAERERDKRLQAAAVNVVAFRRRLPAVQGHPLFEVYGGGGGGGGGQQRLSNPAAKVLPAEEEIAVKLLKGESIFSLRSLN